MENIIATSEVLGLVETPQGMAQLCASADAEYDARGSPLVVLLRAFLRPGEPRVNGKNLCAPVLPATRTVTEAIDYEESADVAREIFHHWARKEREAAPQLRPA